MSLSINPASASSSEQDSPQGTDRISDDETLKKALARAKEDRQHEPLESLSLAAMATLVMPLARPPAPIQQGVQGGQVAGSAAVRAEHAQAVAGKVLRAKMMAQSGLVPDARPPAVLPTLTNGVSADPVSPPVMTPASAGGSVSGDAPVATSGASAVSVAPIGGQPHSSQAVWSGSTTKSALTPATGLTSTSSSANQPTQGADTPEALASATPADTPAGKGAGDTAADKKNRDKESPVASDAGMAALTTASPNDSPLFTQVQEAFGGAPHKPATHAPSSPPGGQKSDNQGITYTFNSFGAGNHSVQIAGTAQTGYTAKPSNRAVASLLESKLPTDGSLSLRIDAADADPDNKLAVASATDSEKKDQAEQ